MARWLVPLWVIVLVTGCSDPAASRAEKTTPEAPPISVFISSEAEAAAQGAGVDLSAVVDASIAAVGEHLELAEALLHVEVRADHAVPQVGVGGRTNPNGDVVLSLDPESPRWKWTLTSALPLTLAHELHHSTRILDGPGYGDTLGEALVSEGLADAFSIQAYPAASDSTHPWTKALDDATTCHAWRRAQKELDSASYDHAEWFFGTGRRIPLWTGYRLGAEVVDDYLARHAGDSAATLIDVDAPAILEGSQVCA